VSTLNVVATIKFMGVSFGCNRCKTRKKTQTSKEKTAEENGEKKRSQVMRVGWEATKSHVFS
jgi:hypothetical protein